MNHILPVIEIFKSIQGESTLAGRPCAFVRTAGCNLRCSYCDTRYAWEEQGSQMSVDEILEKLESLGCTLVCVTGGEPLLHEAVTPLCRKLLARGHGVIVETNGSQDVSCLPSDVVTVMDIKCPGSGECGKTLWSNLRELSGRDQVKFVISDRRDFEWAAECLNEHESLRAMPVLFSPAWGQLGGRELAEWILTSELDVRLQLQLHKILWPDKSRGV